MSRFPSPIAGALLLLALPFPARPDGADAGGEHAVQGTSEPIYSGGDAALERSVWRALERAERGTLTREELVWPVVDLGSRAVPVLFAILCGELAEPGAREPRDRRAQDRDWLIVDALARMPGASTVDHVRSVCRGNPRPDVCLTGALVVGEAAGANGIEALADVLSGLDSTLLHSPDVSARIERALARLMERNTRLLRDLARDPDVLPEEMLQIAARALPEDAAIDSARVLLALFGRRADLDPVLMRKLSELAQSPYGLGDVWTLDEALAAVRGYLSHHDWRLKREATVTLGYLHDVDSYPALVRLLDDEEQAVRRAAEWSLERIAGVERGDPEAWLDFFDTQTEWFHARLPELEQDLESRSDARVVDCVKDLVRHPLFRHDIVVLLDPLVLGGNPILVEVACSAVAQLGSPRAIPTLVAALDHHESRSRKAVWKALKSLSGHSYPPERATWEEALGL